MSTQIKKFFTKYRPMAIKAAGNTGVFPDTILSAAYVESAGGRSLLSSKYNNFFGVKAGAGWNGKKVTLSTKEEVKGKVITIPQDFRVYESPEDSFANYVKFISGPRYQKAGVLKASSPEEQIKAIKAAGYATASNYVQVLTSVLNAGKVAIIPALLIGAIFFLYLI